MAIGTTATSFWRRPIRLRPSVRNLLILVLAVGVGLGWVVHKARGAKVQRDLVAAVRQAGGGVNYDRHPDGDGSYIQEDPWPDWLISLVGIDALATVTQVDDTGFGFEDDALAVVARFDRLESVVLRNCNKLSGAGLGHLRGKAGLKELVEGDGNNHGPSKFMATGLDYLEGCTGLERLWIDGRTSLSGADFARLSGLTGLRTLTLYGDGRSTVTDAAVAHLGTLRKLRRLVLGGKMAISDEGVAHLGKLTRLESLTLDLDRITDLKGLAPLDGLKSLTVYPAPRMTDLDGLESLVGLEKLTMYRVPFDDRGFAPMAGLRSIRWLAIYDAPGLTDSGMVHFRGLASLEDLTLGNTKITDAGLDCLRGCPKLDRLSLSGSQVGDEGLLGLVGRKDYHSIGLSKTKITPAGIKAARVIRPDALIQGP